MAQATNQVTPTSRKRAVVVIHGIGNQSPMTTLRGFVGSVWTDCGNLAKTPPARTWTKRDFMSANYELRRITTNFDKTDRRTDFFEFYWADQLEDTQLADVIWWIRRLFWRRADRVPPALRGAWRVGIATISLSIVGALLFGLLQLEVLKHSLYSIPKALFLLVVATAVSLFFWWVRHVVFVQIVGDAARYLTASPPNIAGRSRIRMLGLKLLASLHKNDDYDRIILVCHSLGTVIGYDILSFYWSTVNTDISHKTDDQALKALERSITMLKDRPDDREALTTYRNAQREYARAVLEASQNKWKVTDFVTLGSPLTHAPLLMVDDREDILRSDHSAIDQGWLAKWRARLDSTTREVSRLLFARMAQREFPICPPLPEGGESFTYASDKSGRVTPHHAAVFAPVRWTNIFAPCRRVLWGDLIGGPLAPLFGPGVKDVPLSGDVGSMLAAHTHYWDQGRKDDGHLEALRAAINLLDSNETAMT